MLRRPSGSTDEDEPESSKDSKGPFSSAKSDASRHSDTLDRRKVEKALISNELSPPEWSPTKHTSNTKQGQDPRASGGVSTAKESTGAMDFGEWRRPRLRSPWKCSLLTLATSALSIILLLSIVNSFFTRHLDPKGCKNCLMRPMFGKFEGFDTEHTRFASKYSLHLYREGGVNEDMTASLLARVHKVEANRTRLVASRYYSSQVTQEAISKFVPLQQKPPTTLLSTCKMMWTLPSPA